MSGARHLDTLRQRLSGCMVRRVRGEVLRQLPPRTDTTVPVELTDAQREEHDALRIIANGLGQVRFATDAGGVGLNLQRAASCCVNIELPWNPAVLEQRIGRIYRLGQKRPIDVYNLVSDACIEGRIAMLVSGKKALFTGLFDTGSDEVRFDRCGSFIARLEQIVESMQVPDLPEDRDGAQDTDAAEAPPEAAATLAALFEGMASLLRAQAVR